MVKVLIAGSGLTGLSAAYHLEKKATFDVSIVEKLSVPGGLLRSETVSGFTFDHTGHYLHINDEYFRYFLETVFGFAQLQTIERKAAVYNNQVLVEYPYQMHLYGQPLSVIIDCIEGFMKRSDRYKNPATFYQWVLKYFGKGFGEHFFFPFNGKLLAYDVKKIHPSWTGRFVPKIELDNLLQGALTNKKTTAGYNSNFFYPKQGGISGLITALIKRLFSPIAYEHEVVEVNVDLKKVFFANGTVKSYDYFISTMPLNILLKKLKGHAVDKISLASRKLLCNTVINYNIGVDYHIPCDQHWIYFPERAYRAYRVGFWSNVSRSLAPEGSSSLYGECSFLPGRITEDGKKRLRDEAIAQTCKVFDIPSQSIIMQKNLVLEHAYVIYDAWRERNLTSLLAQLKEWNIYSIGRFGEWKYSSMQEAVLDGRSVVDMIEADLALYQSKYITHATKEGMQL